MQPERVLLRGEQRRDLEVVHERRGRDGLGPTRAEGRVLLRAIRSEENRQETGARQTVKKRVGCDRGMRALKGMGTKSLSRNDEQFKQAPRHDTLIIKSISVWCGASLGFAAVGSKCPRAAAAAAVVVAHRFTKKPSTVHVTDRAAPVLALLEPAPEPAPAASSTNRMSR
jgi:hypothetical protein